MNQIWEKVKQIIQKIKKYEVPHPIQNFKRKYRLEQDIDEFKNILRNNKFKIFFGFLSVNLLFNKSKIEKYIDDRLENELYKSLSSEQKSFNFVVSFLKQALIEILQDPESQFEGSQFLDQLSRKQQVVDSISLLLIEVLKDEEIKTETYKLAKILIQQLLKDPEIQQDVRELLIKLMNDQQFILELTQLAKHTLTDPEVGSALVQLFEFGFQDQKMKDATKQLLQYALFEILMDPNTAEKIKLFSYLVLEQDDSNKQQVQNILDVIAQKLAQPQKTVYNNDVQSIIEEAQNKEYNNKRFYFF